MDGLIAATAVNGSAKVTFGYDAEKRLTETDTWSPDGHGGWTLAGTVRNAWDGSHLIGQFDGNNKLLRSFAWGPTGLLGITELTGATPVTYVPVKDATGSIVQLLDTSGNVVADYHYDAWGVRTAAGPAAGACPFGFAGMPPWVHASPAGPAAQATAAARMEGRPLPTYLKPIEP